MHPPRRRLSKILNSFIRPSRPPKCTSSNRFPRAPILRLFTSRAQLRILARPANRPQLPFLFGGRRHPAAPRFISTDEKESFKYTLRLGLYYSAIGWTLVGAYYVAYAILRQDWLDRLYPSPPEWYAVTKYHWREAKHEEVTEGCGKGYAFEDDHLSMRPFVWSYGHLELQLCAINQED